MAAISQTIFSDAFWSILIKLILISLKFAPQGPVDNNPALVQITAWRRQAVIWTNAALIHRRIYAALGGDEITTQYLL